MAKREQVQKTRKASQNRGEDSVQESSGTVDRARARKARRRALRASRLAAAWLKETERT